MSEAVRSMFSQISGDYDKMNNLFTLRMHNNWKKKLVRLSGAKPGDKVLDIASGTGDLALLFKEKTGEGEVVATDFCDDMLKYVDPKAKKLGLDIKVELADAMDLQYADDTFDIASISYGIRNVDDTATALKEMARVVKSGGKVAILETGQPSSVLKPFYKIVTRGILPIMGKMVAGNKEAYTYLAETASYYPYGKIFLKIMEETGAFSSMKAYPQFFGASYIYIAEVK